MIITLQTLIFFRQTLITVIERFLKPYYKKLSLKFGRDEISDDEDSDDHVIGEYDEEKGVVFYPPVYAQRYAAVSDCLMDERWCGKLEKVVDFGYHDVSFIKYLKDVPGVTQILGVDLESIPLRCSSDLLGYENYMSKRETPLKVTLFQGNAADPDYRLIGCDAVIAIEMIEHMLPHDLDRLIHTVFGFIKPWVAIFTTPNSDFNILFKSLEKNGLRRLDHLFEWSREQFNDWCSNIVSRYPEYTVTCKGIGPGPPETLRLGCCSQLALFYAKDYHKQPDLNLNSMALVANAPSQNNICEKVGGWESPNMTENMICMPNSVESYAELVFDQQSCMTLVLASSSFSLESVEYKDAILQCNLESEMSKSFLMFDDDLCYTVLRPRKEKYYRVYEIEDVSSRLNCSTFQVKKFSKPTQNLMAKNKTDSFVHTRAVVDEIRYLTKMLDFNKETNGEYQKNIWCNINWGVNAPYWNQYYRIVREYNYPFETKTDECRILDIISEEINRLVDSEYDKDFSVDSNKLEIPMDHLMTVVEHITDDVGKVKDLLEWNGYEVVDNVVIHSRLVVDNQSDITQEEDWQDEVTSDWDTTDVRSTTLSESSTIVPDFYGQYLHRALDHKVRKLRTLLTADEDIATELDHVVCRLMKLALSTSKTRQNPPPINWMQCKLFDLLSLTEKALERRRLKLLDYKYPYKAIKYCNDIGDIKNVLSDDKKMVDLVAERIMTHYDQLDPLFDDRDDTNFDSERYPDSEFDEFRSIASNEFKDENDNDLKYTYNKDEFPRDQVAAEPIQKKALMSKESDDKSYNNLKIAKCHINKSGSHISYENIYSSSNIIKKNNMEPECKIQTLSQEVFKFNNSNMVFKSESKRILKSQSKNIINSKHSIHKCNRTNISKKVSSKNLSYFNFIKYDCVEYKQYKTKGKKKSKESAKLNSTTRPIPTSLIELCCSRSNPKNSKRMDLPVSQNVTSSHVYELNSAVAEPEESLFIGIVTEDGEETIAMRRNIGTDPETYWGISENEALLETVINITKEDSFYCKPNIETENVQSQTIFLNDLNEPSTSKGVRHLSADVQCGSDVNITRNVLSATTSFTKFPDLFNTGIKIDDPNTEFIAEKNTYDFGTHTEYDDKILRGTRKSVGIKIKDSETYIYDNTACFTATQDNNDIKFTPLSEHLSFDSRTETIKPVSSALKIEDSGSEAGGSTSSYPKLLPAFIRQSKNTSDFQIQSESNEKNVVAKLSQVSYGGPKLACGAIHVHSFKEKKGTEDVVFQGEWQRKQNLGRKNVNSQRKNGLLLKKRRKDVKGSNDDQEKKKFTKKLTTAPKSVVNGNKRKSEVKTDQIKRKYVPHTINTMKRDVKTVSKGAVSSHVLKNIKTIYTTKKRVNFINKEHDVKIKTDVLSNRSLKNYLPLYLRKKLQYSNVNCDAKSYLNSKNMFRNGAKNMLEHNVNKVTKDLLKIPEKPQMNNNYMIFRNEIEKRSSNKEEPLIKNDDVNKRLQSPQSQNSSPCSSPNSVATVRVASTRRRIVSEQKTSTSSEISNSCVLESENKTTKTKNFSRRIKGNKKPTPYDNKENVPESSNNSLKASYNKDRKTIEKSNYLDTAQSVFMAQMKTESSALPLTSTAVSKTKTIPLDESIKMLNINNTNEQMCQSSSIPTFQKELLNKRSVLNYIENNPSYIEDNNMLILESNTNSYLNDNQDSNETISSIHDQLIKSPQKSLHNTKSSIISAIRELIENKLKLSENNSMDSDNSDSETVILGREDIFVNSSHDSASPNMSIKTVITNENTCLSESDVEYFVNNSSGIIDKSNTMVSSLEMKFPDNEPDLISLKSFASTSTSKFSEYYLADNELDNPSPHADTMNISSIQDLFERKDQSIVPVVGGIPIQSFSGFSVNETIAGDQPDYINLVDSETGSYAFESTRQAASEEIFVSGRSSDTYESCYVEDDAYVPNWLFNIISQQQSAEESEAEEIDMPIQMAEPAFDMNGNTMEPGIGVGAGAGDGRGMHSDHSQDSSGRGTSISSSETSSGQQSEAILIDPSAFTGQAGFLRVSSITMSTVVTSDGQSLSHIVEDDVGENVSNVRNVNVRNLSNTGQIVSDFDADVSSLDTDAIDSD